MSVAFSRVRKAIESPAQKPHRNHDQTGDYLLRPAEASTTESGWANSGVVQRRAHSSPAATVERPENLGKSPTAGRGNGADPQQR